MEFRSVWALRGPSFWSKSTALEMVLDLAALKARPLELFPGLADRLRCKDARP